jgi:hypothetical protein
MSLSCMRAGVSLIGAVVFLAWAQPARAQSAGLTGTVRTQSGSPLAGVRVHLTGGGTAAVTDGAGEFRLTLAPGTAATLRLDHDDHVAETIAIQPLLPGELRTLAVTLAPLYRLDAVNVVSVSERPLLDTEEAATGGALEELELRVLPADARNVLGLAFTIPGVAQSTGFFGDAPPLTITGANSLYTQYTFDGLENNEGFLGGPRVELPLAALARLDVLATTYGAAAGRSSNGVVDAISRAGGTRWTGEAFLFGRPGTPFDAQPAFAPAGTDPDGFRRVQAGGSMGGPLREGRTFVFAAAEYTNETEDRIGSTASTQFVGTELREIAKAFARLDHGWSRTQTTTLRFALSDVQRAGRGTGVVVPEADITTIRRGSITALTHRTELRGGRAANEVSAQFGTFRWDFPPTRSDFTRPQVTIVGQDLTTVEAVVGSSNFVFDERERQVQLRDVYSMQTGRHTLRVGADVVRSWFELDAAGTNPQGAYTVINDGNIAPAGRFLSITDVPADVRVLRYTIDARPKAVDLTQTLVGVFIDDRWRITPSLTVHLGLRWDYDDITSRGESDPDLDNLQPRLSFNWLANGSTVIRGGAGAYTGKLPYAVYSDAVQFGPDGNAVVTFESAAFPPPRFGAGPTAQDLAALRDQLPPREMRRTFALGLEQPMSWQFSLGYQRMLSADWSIAADGVWVETRDLPRSRDLNAIERALTPADTVDRSVEFGDAFRPVSPVPGGFRRLTTTESGGRARHVALHTSVRGNLGAQLRLDANWIWSRTRNDTEDINFNAAHANDFEAEWADAINDRRHRIALRGVWSPLARVRLAGIADYQTGTPINRVAWFRDLDGSGAIFGNGFIGNHDRFPGVARNAERLPAAFRMDAGVAWSLPVRSGSMEVRADVFNVLNSTLHTGFANGIPGGGPRTQVGRPGDPIVYTAAAPRRQLQLAMSYLIGR